ncbi:MAG: urease accessory protein UreF [Rhodobacteraceae bacterium]|nr:urease accessory protein UreF [Paracoccaceae bacterium]
MATLRTEAETRDLLALVQWLSPAFPVGSYAFSHGLEQAVAAGDVRDAPAFAAWLGTIVLHGSGWCDAVLVSLAHRGSHSAAELAALSSALAAGSERWRETAEQGAAFLKATNALLDTAYPPMPLPVAVGVQARRLSLPTETVVGLYLQAFTGNLATIAARIVPLGQTAAQRCLAGLAPEISGLAGRAAIAGLDDLASGAFRGDLAAMVHETLDVRLFQS